MKRMEPIEPFHCLPVGAKFRRPGRPYIWHKVDTQRAWIPETMRPDRKPIYIFFFRDAEVIPILSNQED